MSILLGPPPENAFVVAARDIISAARDIIPAARERLTIASTRGNLRGRGRERSNSSRGLGDGAARRGGKF
jgi:hypothetical protein